VVRCCEEMESLSPRPLVPASVRHYAVTKKTRHVMPFWACTGGLSAPASVGVHVFDDRSARDEIPFAGREKRASTASADVQTTDGAEQDGGEMASLCFLPPSLPARGARATRNVREVSCPKWLEFASSTNPPVPPAPAACRSPSARRLEPSHPGVMEVRRHRSTPTIVRNGQDSEAAPATVARVAIRANTPPARGAMAQPRPRFRA